MGISLVALKGVQKVIKHSPVARRMYSFTLFFMIFNLVLSFFQILQMYTKYTYTCISYIKLQETTRSIDKFSVEVNGSKKKCKIG